MWTIGKLATRSLIVLLVAVSAWAAPPLHVFEGDGMTIRVLTLSDDEEAVTGDLTSRNATYPFTARLSSDGDVALYRGTFRDADEAVPFSATQREGEDTLIFVTRGRQYRLREVPPKPATSPPPDPSGDRAPPAPTPSARAPEPPTRSAGGDAAVRPEQIKLRKAEFRDVNMGNVVAYTMLVPDGWSVDGHIEWSNDRTPYPQRKIKIVAPDQSWISFTPAAKFEYFETTPLAAVPGRQGEPPPKDLGAWIVSTISRHNKQVTDVRLVSDERDALGEAALAAETRATGVPRTGIWEKHVVTFRFVLDGIPFTQELRATYTYGPPTQTRNMNFGFWLLFTDSDLRAPTAKWEQMKPLLHASASSLRTVPEWFTQQQLLLMEITRKNHVLGMEEIRRRGQHYSQMSDESFATWKRSVAIGDRQQNDRINAIREVDDFRDTDGLPVKLPIHYKNYYGDGKGNYLMTNSTLEQPGSDWTQLEPMK